MVSDQQFALEFNTEELILKTVELLKDFTGLRSHSFTFNYSDKITRTIKGFRARFKKYSEVVDCFVGFDSNNTNTYFRVANPLLNYVSTAKRPSNSTIQISIQIDESIIKINEVSSLAEKLISDFSFEYGYIHKFPSKKFIGETLVKKGFFNTSISIGEKDHIWTNHQIGFLSGYIKKLYSINYLNKSHMKNLLLSDFINQYGEYKEVSNEVYKWELRNKELQSLKNLDSIKDSCIVTNDLRFLDNAISKELKAKMTVKQ